MDFDGTQLHFDTDDDNTIPDVTTHFANEDMVLSSSAETTRENFL